MAHRIVVLAIALLLSGGAEAAPLACVSPVDGNPGLQSGDPTVVARRVAFARELHSARGSGDVDYWVKTFSATDPSGYGRSEQCFRYEVVNLGTDEHNGESISNFDWPLAGIWADPLKPGLRRSIVRKQQVLDNPIEMDSHLEAFENSSTMTRAWADRTTGDRFAGAGGGEEPPFSRTDLAAIDPRLPSFLQEYKLPVVSVATYTFEQDQGKTPEVVDTYTGPGFTITVRSVAERAGNRIRFQTNVIATGDVAKDASFSMPALQALDLLKPEPDLFDEYRNFLSLYTKMRGEVRANKGEWQFGTEFEAPKSEPIRVFRVSSPISIKHGDARDCVIVTSFAPVAMNFPTRECSSLLHN